MALTFLITFRITKIIRQVIEKRMQERNKKQKIAKLKGYKLKIERLDDSINLEFLAKAEIANTILSCIVGNQDSLVSRSKIKGIKDEKNETISEKECKTEWDGFSEFIPPPRESFEFFNYRVIEYMRDLSTIIKDGRYKKNIEGMAFFK